MSFNIIIYSKASFNQSHIVISVNDYYFVKPWHEILLFWHQVCKLVHCGGGESQNVEHILISSMFVSDQIINSMLSLKLSAKQLNLYLFAIWDPLNCNKCLFQEFNYYTNVHLYIYM